MQPTLNFEGGTTLYSLVVNVTGELSKTVTITVSVTNVRPGLLLAYVWVCVAAVRVGRVLLAVLVDGQSAELVEHQLQWLSFVPSCA